MKIRFLGTGAADWPIKKTAGFSEFRYYSSALVDNTLLIDPGPSVLDAALEFGVDLNQVRYVLNTHRHADHFDLHTLEYLKSGGAVFYDLKPGDCIHAGRYEIKALPANHGTCPDAVHFLINDGNRCMFYGLDGAWLMYETVLAIKSAHVHLAVFDATIGDISGDYRIFEHNNLQMVRKMKESLKGYIDQFVISHMAMALHTDHNTLAKAMAKDGIKVAFDGLEVDI